MRIFAALTYYSPHISGVTIYARRLIRRLVERGHHVTVLTSRFNADLPTRERIDDAMVIRSPVLFLLSKGAVMPFIFWQAFGLIRRSDIVYLHLPQFEACLIALIAKLLRKPVVVTYHCDIELPRGLISALFTPLIRLSHYITGKLADRIVVNTEEYGRTARLPRRFHHKVLNVYPPIELAPTPLNTRDVRARHGFGDAPVVGFVGRFAEEKGIAHLVEAAPLVRREIPNARFALAGLTDTVPGERVHEQLGPKIEALGDAIVHLGRLSDEELTSFYQAMDVLVLPSTNSTESFGMTQAEAMLSGTPVIASDISGVREAVRVTGMGLIVPPGDAVAIAQAIVTVLRDPKRFTRPTNEIERIFDADHTTDFYEQLFEGTLAGRMTFPNHAAHAEEAAAKDGGKPAIDS
jgi:glycosyltransferase involved in cell wall biosynthesis